MNIILVGTNGAGKSTIAGLLYKDGYHIVKEAPMGNEHEALACMCFSDYHMVFDRWNVIDRAIYEKEDQWLALVKGAPELVNKHNVIIYMRNNVVIYNPLPDAARSVQRPSREDAAQLDIAYATYVKYLADAGVKIYFVNVQKDVQKTYQLVQDIIETHKREEEIQ